MTVCTTDDNACLEIIKMVPPRNKNNYHNKLFQAIFNCINHPEIVLSLGKYLMKVKTYLVHSNWTFFTNDAIFVELNAIACYLMPIVHNHTIDKY